MLRFRALSASLASLIALALAGAACTSGSVADDDASDDALKVKPKDTDPQTEASVSVSLPSSPDMDKVTKRPLVVTGRLITGKPFTTPLAYGATFKSRPGAWKVCFAKSTFTGSPPTETLVATTECTDVVTTAGQNVKLVLSVVRTKVSGPPLPAAAPTPDFGPFAGSPHWAHVEPLVDGTECAYDGGLAVFAGSHRVQVRKYADDAVPVDQTVTVGVGEVVTVSATTTSLPQPKPLKLHVTYEAPELPTVNGWSTYTVVGTVADDPATKWNGVFQAGFASRPNGAGEIALTGLVCPTCTASFQNVTHGIAIPFAMTGEVTLALKRLDVDDVEVTPTDGSPVYSAPGKWSVTQTGTAITYGPFDTGFGVDLPAGGYELVIKYDTKKKPAQTQTSHVDL